MTTPLFDGPPTLPRGGEWVDTPPQPITNEEWRKQFSLTRKEDLEQEVTRLRLELQHHDREIITLRRILADVRALTDGIKLSE